MCEQGINQIDELLDKWDVEHFSARELLLHRRWNRCVVPPVEYWHNIKHTVQVAEALRVRLGVPVGVASGYRNDEYNHLVGGVRNSKHRTFYALDLVCPKSVSYLVFVQALMEVLAPYKKRGFHIGVGVYPSQNFVHVDIGARDEDAFWSE